MNGQHPVNEPEPEPETEPEPEPESEPGISVLSLDRIDRIDRIFWILAFGLSSTFHYFLLPLDFTFPLVLLSLSCKLTLFFLLEGVFKYHT